MNGLLPSITGTVTGRQYDIYRGDTCNHSFTQTMPGDSSFNMRMLQPNLFKQNKNLRGIKYDQMSASGKQLMTGRTTDRSAQSYRSWPGKSGQLVSYQHELGRSSA